MQRSSASRGRLPRRRARWRRPSGRHATEHYAGNARQVLASLDLPEPEVEQELGDRAGLAGADLERNGARVGRARRSTLAATEAIASRPSSPATRASRGSYSVISGSSATISLSRT